MPRTPRTPHNKTTQTTTTNIKYFTIEQRRELLAQTMALSGEQRVWRPRAPQSSRSDSPWHPATCSTRRDKVIDTYPREKSTPEKAPGVTRNHFFYFSHGLPLPTPNLLTGGKLILLMTPPRYENPGEQRCAFAELDHEMTPEEFMARLKGVPDVVSVELQSTKTSQKNIPGGNLKAAEAIKKKGSLILNTINTLSVRFIGASHGNRKDGLVPEH